MTAPMDHRALLAGLDAEERARLTARSDRPGLVQLVRHCGAIATFGALIAFGVPGWQLLLVVQGILIVFLFTALHECVHETAFATRRVNKAVAWVCGMALMLPPNWFRYFHFAHHRYTHVPGRDPELATPKPETWRDYLWMLSGLPVWWFHAGTLVRNALGHVTDDFVPDRGRDKVVGEARIMLAVYATLVVASIAAGSALLVWIWLVPALLGQPFLRAYLLAEHGLCPHVANMFENTRTTFTGALVRGLAWNMPYHAEHHAYPAVPFHRLPEFHQLTRAHLQVVAPGYTAFHREYVDKFRSAPFNR